MSRKPISNGISKSVYISNIVIIISHIDFHRPFGFMAFLGSALQPQADTASVFVLLY